MLVNVRSDKEFQAYLDTAEQRLHNQLFPILNAGIRLHLSKGAVHGQNYIVKRGQPVLLRQYKRIYRDVYTQTYHQTKQERTGVGDFMDEMLSYLESRATKLITGISQNVADYIRELIMEGVNEGLSQDEIASEISANVDDISRFRAATIARTETHGAATSAMDDTIEYQGIDVQTKTWLSAGDARVRPSHAAMNGVTVAYSEPFDTDDGPCLYPGDDSLGMDEGGLINCRCVCLYSTESLPSQEGDEEELE